MTRKSERELERAVEDLKADDCEVAGLIRILSTLKAGGDVEPVGRDHVRVNDEVMRLLPNARETLWGPA